MEKETPTELLLPVYTVSTVVPLGVPGAENDEDPL